MDLRINVYSEKQKEVNSRKSGARLRVPMHHLLGRGGSKIHKTRSVQSCTRQSFYMRESESWRTYACGMSGQENARRRTGNGVLLYTRSAFGRRCANPRHPGDPVAGTWGSGGQCGNRKKGSGTSRRFPDAGEIGVCVCVGVCCVFRKAWT